MTVPQDARGGTPPNRCPTCGLAVSPWALLCPRDGTQLQPESLGDGELPPTDIHRNDWERTVVRDLLVGRHLGEYEVVRRIGNGGMGIVYEGRHPELNRKVAIKVLRPELTAAAEHLRTLREEARAANAIRHRGIIDIFGFGQLDGIGQYIVMDFLEGEPLDEVIAEGAPLPPGLVVEVLDELLDALGAAHAGGVIHRDLKPSNVFLVRQTGGSRAVKVLDFGLAKRLERGGAGQAKQSVVAGTPVYMAPEQARGSTIGPQADLYAVGCIAFEMFTGRIPFEGVEPVEIALKHINDPIPSVRSLVSGVPAELDQFVAQLLAKDPARRPASAGLARRELNHASQRQSLARTSPHIAPRQGPPDARQVSTQPVSTPSPVRSGGAALGRPRLAAGAAALGLATLVTAGIWITRGSNLHSAPSPLPPAQELASPGVAISTKTEPSDERAKVRVALPDQKAPAGVELEVPEVSRSAGPRSPELSPGRVPHGKQSSASSQSAQRTTARKSQGEVVVPAAAKTGTLLIDVAPFWANLTLNGKAHGYINRARELELPPGEYEVRLEHSEFRHSGRVTVTAGRAVSVKPGWK